MGVCLFCLIFVGCFEGDVNHNLKVDAEMFSLDIYHCSFLLSLDISKTSERGTNVLLVDCPSLMFWTSFDFLYCIYIIYRYNTYIYYTYIYIPHIITHPFKKTNAVVRLPPRDHSIVPFVTSCGEAATRR